MEYDNDINNIEIINNTNSNKQLISNKSAISGSSISSTKLKKHVDIIDEFFKYCNEGNIDRAYEMLTDECKEVLFPNVETFDSIYYSSLFKEEKKTYTVENWIGDTYQVKITGDILSTGKLDNSKTNQDYITIVENGDSYKLNINNYIGRTNRDKITEVESIKVNIQSIDTYMDYEIYNISVENGTDGTILLNTNDDTKSVYLLDRKNMKYYFYSNEVAESSLLIQSKFTNKFKIKFDNSYSSNRKIEKLVFSKVVLKYDEYKQLENKEEFKDFYQLKVDV